MSIEQQGGDHESRRIRGEDIPVFNHNPAASKEVKRQKDADRARRQAAEGVHLGWKWSRLRKGYMRQHPYCERCGLLGEVVHHIQERSTHPHLTYIWSNLMTLCTHCHDNHHNIGEKK